MLNLVIEKINEQQKGKEDSAVFMVGEQLKDIVRDTPGAAELVLRDLDIPEMSLEKCEAEEEAETDDEMSEMLAELEEKARADFQKSIDKLEKEKEKLQKTVEKQKKQYDTLQLEAKEQADKIERSEAEKAQMQAVIERLQKESLLGSNENMVRLNMCFETAQSDIQSVKAALEKVKDTEQYEKLKEVISKTLAAAVEKLD